MDRNFVGSAKFLPPSKGTHVRWAYAKQPNPIDLNGNERARAKDIKLLTRIIEIDERREWKIINVKRLFCEMRGRERQRLFYKRQTMWRHGVLRRRQKCKQMRATLRMYANRMISRLKGRSSGWVLGFIHLLWWLLLLLLLSQYFVNVCESVLFVLFYLCATICLSRG